MPSEIEVTDAKIPSGEARGPVALVALANALLDMSIGVKDDSLVSTSVCYFLKIDSGA